MSSSDDPSDKMARGATKGLLDWTGEKISELVTKFKNREIAFLENKEMINLVKEAKGSTQWNLYKDHILDRDFRIQFQMGLTLRRMEKAGKYDDLRDLRDKIVQKYGEEGLHRAQIVQNEIFVEYIAAIMRSDYPTQDLEEEIKDFFENIEDRVYFIMEKDKKSEVVRIAINKLDSFSPRIFILSSVYSAMEKCKKIESEITKKVSNYFSELYKSPKKRIYFLKKEVTTS